MSRYINADAISAELREMAENDYFKCAGAPYSVIFERVAETFDKMPTAQPEIIRCKDCKWFGRIGCAVSIVDDSDKPTEKDFCSFAERR